MPPGNLHRRALLPPVTADQAVFVEAVVPVGPAEPCFVDAVDFLPTSLRLDASDSELGVGVVETSQYAGGINGIGIVERYAEGLGRFNALEDIHVVGHHRPVVTRAHAVVPA